MNFIFNKDELAQIKNDIDNGWVPEDMKEYFDILEAEDVERTDNFPTLRFLEFAENEKCNMHIINRDKIKLYELLIYHHNYIRKYFDDIYINNLPYAEAYKDDYEKYEKHVPDLITELHKFALEEYIKTLAPGTVLEDNKYYELFLRFMNSDEIDRYQDDLYALDELDP